MIYLVQTILNAFLKLFPKGTHRNRAIWLALIATIVPLSQLFVIRIFTHIIMHGKQMELTHAIINFTVFFGLFGLSHLATYWQKTYRVKVFNSALKSREGWRSKNTESWDWALAFETNNLLHTFTQVVVLAVFFVTVDWKIGLINIFLILGTLEFIRIMFKRQIDMQEHFALAHKRKENIENVTKVASRIRSAEIGTLISSGTFIITLAVLLIFSFMGLLNSADAVMLFLGFRMQNSNLGQTSSSLMRFARAKANSEAPLKYKGVKPEKMDEDEEFF